MAIGSLEWSDFRRTRCPPPRSLIGTKGVLQSFMIHPSFRMFLALSTLAAATAACSASTEDLGDTTEAEESTDNLEAPKRRVVSAKGELACADAQFVSSGTLRGKFVVAMARELGNFCQEQNATLRKSGKASCGANYCMKALSIKWEPPTINVNAKRSGTGSSSSPGELDAPTAVANTVAWDLNVSFTAKLGKTTELQCENPLNHPTIATALSPDVVAKFDKRLESAVAKCPDEK
jgi:hypothetical protein